MTLTDGAAIYASIVATGAFFLEFRRWVESGVRLRMSVSPKMRTFGELARVSDEEYLFATLVNVGEQPTSIEMMAVLGFKSIFHRVILFRNDWTGVALRPVASPPFPYVLAPGTLWRGGIEYDAELDERAKAGKLFVGLYVSHRKRPILKKVTFRENTQPVDDPSSNEK